MSTTETTSTTSSDRADVLISRVARNAITPQPARAIGSQGGSCAIPVPSRNATPKTAIAEIDTAGNTRYVPSMIQPVRKPVRGPMVSPTNA